MISATEILHGNILIVDDRKANVLFLERMLRGAGYVSITSTMDSSKVCELHLVNRYDLILLDLLMPGMDGFQVMENLREIETGSYIPVLVVTAKPDNKVRALEAGAKDFVSKPFDVAEVLIRVHNMLEVRLLHLETKALYAQVVAEQKVSQHLLLITLPHSIAERLTASAPDAALSDTVLVGESFAEVAVLFYDVVEFTKYVQGASAEVLKGVLNDISAGFDRLSGTSGSTQSKILGDAYLAAVGLSDPVANRTIRASQMALDLIEAIDRFNGHSRYKLKLRIGLGTDSAKDDAVGKHNMVFDL